MVLFQRCQEAFSLAFAHLEKLEGDDEIKWKEFQVFSIIPIKIVLINFVMIKLLFIGLGQYKPEFRGFRSYEWHNGHTGISDGGKPYGNRLIFKHYGQDILTPCPSPQSTPNGNWTIDIGGNPDVMDVRK